MMMETRLKYLISVSLLYLGIAQSQDACIKLDEKCNKTEECCLGTCVVGYCNDGLYRNNRDRSHTPEQWELIYSELATGKNLDVSNHKNIHLLPSTDQCGYSKNQGGLVRKKRIVGGIPYELGKYPWAVSLHLNGMSDDASHFTCGASLINNQYVITAAHCVTRLQTGKMLNRVTLGNVDRRMKYGCEQNGTCTDGFYLDVEIEEWIVHEDYSEAHVRADIALIKLKQEVNFTDYIRPICLPKSDNIFKKWPDGKLTVIGWGTQNAPNDHGPKVISWRAQEIQNFLVHRSNCDRFYSRNTGSLRKSQICAGGYAGKGDCAGDSGGSLFKNLNMAEEDYGLGSEERYVLFGLVSTGAVVECGREGKPSVYTNVMYFMPWILNNLEPSKRKLVGESIAKTIVNPVDEFATGKSPQVDVSKHANIDLLPAFPKCGIIPGLEYNVNSHTRAKRLVGGMSQQIGSFPWLAQIYVRHVVSAELFLRCGGFLITPRHVVTAAHCVIDIRGPFVLDGVILGNSNRRDKTECIDGDCFVQNMIPIEDMYTHHGYSKFAREMDIAVIKLDREISYNRVIQPICLPLRESIVAKAWQGKDRRYTIAGWGRVTAESAEAVMSNLLIASNLTLESKKYCESALTRRNGKLESSRICGGGSFPGRGECIGDTGGPMMRAVTMTAADGKNYTRMHAFGILSYVECAHQGIPSLYQNLLYHMPWLMDQLEF